MVIVIIVITLAIVIRGPDLKTDKTMDKIIDKIFNLSNNQFSHL
jgi:hypothetical protein